MMRNCSSSANGFSLPEVMIAVVLLGLLAGVTGPNLFNLIRTQRLRSAAVNLIYQLNAARGAAQRTNSTCALEQDGSVIQPIANSCGNQSPPPVDLGIDAQGDTIVLSGVTSFTFAPGGMLAGTSADQVAVLSITGFTPRLCVRVQVPSGLVSIGSASDGNAINCSYNQS